jgi:hypothetical protein
VFLDICGSLRLLGFLSAGMIHPEKHIQKYYTTDFMFHEHTEHKTKKQEPAFLQKPALPGGGHI